MIRLLSPLAYRVMPWKNGGGTTTEIATHPEDAGWDDFLWRVGIAEIAQSGPFSIFPGIDRSIMLLDCAQGSGMNLSVDGRSFEMEQHKFVDFPGEAVTHGVLRGEPVRDFNVMIRRGSFTHRRGWKSIVWQEWFRLGGSDMRFVHVTAGEARLVGGESLKSIAAGESVLVSGDEQLNLYGGKSGAKMVWATFTQVAGAECDTPQGRRDFEHDQ